jgi:hypothetical protein
MKHLAVVFLCSVATLARAADLEPAVKTSSAAALPAPTPSAKTAPAPAVTSPAAAPAAQPAARKPAGAKPRALDQIELDVTQITGNRELPNVMYVVPWKRPDLGEFAGRPPKSLLDELLAPVDRDVFRRQNRYFAALHPDAAVTPPAPAATPAAGAATTLPAGDEK